MLMIIRGLRILSPSASPRTLTGFRRASRLPAKICCAVGGRFAVVNAHKEMRLGVRVRV